jgi:hypothetical protein
MERGAHVNFMKKRRYAGAIGDPTALKKGVDRANNGDSYSEEFAEIADLDGTPVTPRTDSESNSRESWTFRRIRARNLLPRASRTAGNRPPFRPLVSESSGSSEDEAALLPLEQQSTFPLERMPRRLETDASGEDILESSILGKQQGRPTRVCSDSNLTIDDATPTHLRQERLDERGSVEPLQAEITPKQRTNGRSLTSSRILVTSEDAQVRRPIIDLESIVKMNEDSLRFRGLSYEASGLKRGSRDFCQARRAVEHRFIDKEARQACDDGFGGESDDSVASDEDFDGESDGDYDLKQLSVRKAWRKKCRQMEPSLFASNPASRMEAHNLSPRQPGEQGYSGLGMDEKCSCDMERIYSLQFQPGEMRGVRSSYAHLRVSLSQYARLCVCLDLVSLKDLWMPGKVFSLLLEHSALRIFFSYFRLRGQPTTVSNKAANLKLASKHASYYFKAIGNSVMDGRANEAFVYISECRKWERREIRRTSRHTLEGKMACGKLLEEKDMNAFEDIAYKKCRDLVRSATECLGGAAELFGDTRAGQQRLNKWALNFMVYLMFVAGGQRPQVFRSLVVPEETELSAWRRDGKRAEVALHVPLEKTPRSRECPAVQFPVRAARLIAFQVREVRPFIFSRVGHTESPSTQSVLLLHTKTGEPLTTDELRSGLSRFLVAQDPELKGITPMVLRSSFASIMFKKFKDGSIDDGKTLEQFLSDLGQVMNTSPEMLMSNYMAYDPLDFPSSVKRLFKAFQREGPEEDWQS